MDVGLVFTVCLLFVSSSKVAVSVLGVETVLCWSCFSGCSQQLLSASVLSKVL